MNTTGMKSTDGQHQIPTDAASDSGQGMEKTSETDIDALSTEPKRKDASKSEAEVKIQLQKVLEKYVSTNVKSWEAYSRAETALPGGNTRSVLAYRPFPLILESGRDCFVTSVDGTEYLDFVSEYSAGIYGHSNPQLRTAVLEALSSGTNLGGLTEKETTFAHLIQNRFPSIELVRFCNSGTEANLMAIATAQVHTKRRKILVFDNGYHGGLISIHADAETPTNVPHQFVIAPYNDIEATAKLLNNEIAAVLVEPVLGAGGCIPGKAEFLQYLRTQSSKVGALLIFDEVMTSRLNFYGMQGYHNITPDMTTLGKYLGGGFAFGAFGGRRDIMDRFGLAKPGSKERKLAHSGTFNNNTFTMSAGIAGMHILTPEVFDRMAQVGDRLRNGINEISRRNGIEDKFFSTGFASLVGLHMVGTQCEDLLEIFFFYLVERGLYIGKRGFFSINMMHTIEHVDRALRAIDDFVVEFQPAFL